LDAPKQEADYQDLAAIKPSLIIVIVGAQATMSKPCIACRAPVDRKVMSVNPQEAWMEARSSRRHPKGERRCENDAHRTTQIGLDFHPKSLLQGMNRSRRFHNGISKKKSDDHNRYRPARVEKAFARSFWTTIPM
jgi:hypothetical protein